MARLSESCARIGSFIRPQAPDAPEQPICTAQGQFRNKQMTLSEVEEILGKADQTKQQSSKVGYRWSNVDEHIIVEFRDNKIVEIKLEMQATLSTGKRVSALLVESAYVWEVRRHPELAKADWHDPQLAQGLARVIKDDPSSFFFDYDNYFTITEVIDILRLGQALAEQAK